MKIHVWDNGGITMDRYLVLISKDKHCIAHGYDMSDHPDRANEVNMYAGEFKSDIEQIKHAMKTMQFTYIPKIPKSLKYAIRQRCQEIRLAARDE